MSTTDTTRQLPMTAEEIDDLPPVIPLRKLSVPTVTAMIRKGYGPTAIARAHGVKHPTVIQFCDRHADEIHDLLGYRQEITDLLKEKCLVALRAMTPAKADKESFFYLSRALESGVKLVELLEGNATERIDHGKASAQLEEIRKQKERIEAEIAELEREVVDITPDEEQKDGL